MPGPNGDPYVTPAQLLNYIPAATLNLATLTQQQQACADATEEADGFMNGRYTMPLLDWPSDVTKFTAYIAIHNLAEGPIGYASQSGSDKGIKENYYRAVGWPDRPGTGYFNEVQRQARHPAVTPSVAIGSDPVRDLPQVTSLPMRGWQRTNRVGGF